MGTMALEGTEFYSVEYLTISTSTFSNNESPNGSAIYSCLSIHANFIDLTIIGNETTVGNGFIALDVHIESFEIHV